MSNEERLIKNFDNVIGTNKYKTFDKDKFPLLLKLFKQLREEMCVSTEEYENLKKNKKELLDEIDIIFNKEQKRLFEEYWKIENEMISIIEEEIFLFGYLIKDELDIENKV